MTKTKQDGAIEAPRLDRQGQPSKQHYTAPSLQRLLVEGSEGKIYAPSEHSASGVSFGSAS